MTGLARGRGRYDDDHESFRESVRRFVADALAPGLETWRAAGGVPPEVFAEAGEYGFLGVSVPEEFGGGGVDDPRFLAVLVEEAMRVGATGFALVCAAHSGVCIPVLVRHGSPRQRREWLSCLAAGTALAVPAGFGRPLRVSAAAGGEGEGQDEGQAEGRRQGQVVSGDARSVVGGALAELLVIALDGDNGGPAAGLVAVSAPGLSRLPVRDGLAGRDGASADVLLDGLQLDGDAVLGGEAALGGEAVPGAAVDDVHALVDLWHAVLGVAGARRALALAAAYAADRKVFGRPVTTFQNTQHRLAEAATQLDVAEAFVDARVEAYAAGELDAVRLAQARLVATAVHDQAVDLGLQLHGGYGYMREYPIAQAYADARYLRLHAEATSDARAVVAAGLGFARTASPASSASPVNGSGRAAGRGGAPLVSLG